MNNKAIYVLHGWSQCIFATVGLELLRHISSVRLLLKKRHTKGKVSWPIVYRVTDKDISVKMSSAHV